MKNFLRCALIFSCAVTLNASPITINLDANGLLTAIYNGAPLPPLSPGSPEYIVPVSGLFAPPPDYVPPAPGQLQYPMGSMQTRLEQGWITVGSFYSYSDGYCMLIETFADNDWASLGSLYLCGDLFDIGLRDSDNAVVLVSVADNRSDDTFRGLGAKVPENGITLPFAGITTVLLIAARRCRVRRC